MKNTILLLLLAITSFIFAQNDCIISANGLVTDNALKKIEYSNDKATMVVYPGNWQQVNAVTTYKYDGCSQMGWVFGNNAYHVIGAGAKFHTETPLEIIGAYFWFGSIADGNNNITFSVFDFSDNRPGDILTSKTVSQKDVTSLATYNVLPSDFINSFYLEFDEPIIVTGEYFLGFDVSELIWEQPGDGAGLVSGMIGQGGGGADIAYILSKGEGWQIAQEWDYQLNLDLAIFPVVTKEIVTYSVSFVLDTEDACFYENIQFEPEIHSIFVSGTFNDWAIPGSDDNYKLTQNEKTGNSTNKAQTNNNEFTFSLNLDIEEGEHEYKYFLVIDEPTWEHGEWQGPPNRQFSANQDLFLEDFANSGCSTNISEIEENNLSLFPNPTKDKIIISSASLIKHIKIISIEGRLIKNLEINSNNTTVDLEPYKNGIYILQATTEEGAKSFKIFKVK